MVRSKEKFIALMGLGYWGKNILRNLHELGVLHTACDLDPDVVRERKEKFPDVDYAASYKKVLESPAIKAVVIATPAMTHYGLAREALSSGKDVFVEKPLSATVSEGEDLVRLAEREGRLLMVGHILQYHPAVIRLKEMIDAGELGKIHYVYSNRLNIGKLRTEENILWSFAPHDISVILMLLEEEPVRVSAFGGDYLNNGVYDTTLTTLEFSGGVKGHIFVSWLHPFKEQKLIVVGSKAMAVFDDMSRDKLFLYPHRISWKSGKVPVAEKAEHKAIELKKKEPLREELRHFAGCVLERKTPKTDGREGLRVLRILDAAERSMTSSKASLVSPNAMTGVSSSAQYFVHESAVVDDGARIGKGTKIWHFSHILKDSRVGENCVIGQNVTVGPGVEIGNGCKIQNNVSVYSGVVLEDGVFCGPSCVFTNVYNPRAFIERKAEFKNTIVREGATLGANSTIVCGLTIGRFALVGAGAVVKKDVPDYAVVAGVPARQIGWACRCGTTLKFSDGQSVCGYCGSEYGLEGSMFSVIKENR